MPPKLLESGVSPVKRSRNGCAECRRRHRRCDEAKPSCTHCQGTRRVCVYVRQLSWGGRQFKKSRFGKCLAQDENIIKIDADHASTRASFVYGRRQRFSQSSRHSMTMETPLSTRVTSIPVEEEPQVMPLSQPRASDSDTSHTASNDESPPLAIIFSFSRRKDEFRSLSNLSWIPRALRSLLDYFVHGMTRSMSCHKGIQDDICSSLIPMALDCPHLFAAVLSLAASHRQSVGLEQSCHQIEHLRSSSVKTLGVALRSPNSPANERTLATTLLLCMTDITAGRTSSWRLHLGGAEILLNNLESTGHTSASSTLLFLRRLYVSLEAIAMSCGVQRYDGQETTLVEREEGTYVEDLCGFTTSLLPIFEEINGLDMTSTVHEICGQPLPSPHFHCRSTLQHRSHILFDRVRGMIADRVMSFRSIYLSQLERHDFFVLDEAYHYMALVQIYRRGDLTIPFQLVQEFVQKIIACISSLTFLDDRPCPAAGALPPLFIAGCAASTKPDREAVLELLTRLWTCFGMGNVRTAQRVLDRSWKLQDEATSSSPTREDVLSIYSHARFAGHPDIISDAEIDLLPY